MSSTASRTRSSNPTSSPTRRSARNSSAGESNRWKKNIRKLDFSSTGINTIVQPLLLTTITIFNCFSASLSLQNPYITLSFSWRMRMEKEAEGERRRRDLILLSDLIFWSDWV
ncbi:hypothetical protein LINPERHAP1_LOCUS15345 [Linum perenne]